LEYENNDENWYITSVGLQLKDLALVRNAWTEQSVRRESVETSRRPKTDKESSFANYTCSTIAS